jgi:hypothetical protein
MVDRVAIRRVGTWLALTAILALAEPAASAWAAGQRDEPPHPAHSMQMVAGQGGERYRILPFDIRPLRWRALVPYISRPSRIALKPPLDSEGVPMKRVNGRLYYSPTDLGMEALRRLKSWMWTDRPIYLRQVRMLARKLRDISIEADGATWLPFRYDVPNNRMRAPWYNALPQGLALALFSRLHRIFRRPRDLAFADGLFRSFLRLRRPGHPWFARVDGSNLLWLEHWPDGVHGKVLNAHAIAVLGVRDYWQQAPSKRVRRVLEAGITTMRLRAERFRRPGTWSWKNLVNPVAHRKYHTWHVDLLYALGAASGDPWFRRLGRRFAADYP